MWSIPLCLYLTMIGHGKLDLYIVVKISKHLTEGKIKFREQKLKWKWQKGGQRDSTVRDIAWQLNHCNRCITLHSDADISFGLFNLFNTYFYVFWMIVNTCNSKFKRNFENKLNRTKHTCISKSPRSFDEWYVYHSDLSWYVSECTVALNVLPCRSLEH